MRQKDFVKIAPLFSPIGRNFSPKSLYSLYTQNLPKNSTQTFFPVLYKFLFVYLNFTEKPELRF